MKLTTDNSTEVLRHERHDVTSSIILSRIINNCSSCTNENVYEQYVSLRKEKLLRTYYYGTMRIWLHDEIIIFPKENDKISNNVDKYCST